MSDSTVIEMKDYLDSLDTTASPSNDAVLLTKETGGEPKTVTKNNLTTGKMVYKGQWNANTNTPTLGNSGAGGVRGDYYIVSTAGSTSIEGVTDWKVGDWIVHNGTTWDKQDNSGVEEAPIDGNQYARKDAGWVEVVASATIDWEVSFPAGSFDYPSTYWAPWEKYAGSNNQIVAHWFDDATEEFLLFQFKVPTDSVSTGDITFYFDGTSKLTDTGGDNKIAWKLYYLFKSNGENIDVAKSDILATEIIVNDNALYLDQKSFTKTFSELGVAPGDVGFMKISRVIPATAADQRNGDYGLINLRISSARA